MGVTNMFQHKIDISNFKPNSKPWANKVRIFRIEGVYFFTAFVGGFTGNKIFGLIKGYNGSCNKYNTHANREKGDVDGAFYMTPHDTNLFLKPLVSFIILYSNQDFLSQVGEDLSNDTAMDIMDEVNRTPNT